jgi:hypothetical protein
MTSTQNLKATSHQNHSIDKIKTMWYEQVNKRK